MSQLEAALSAYAIHVLDGAVQLLLDQRKGSIVQNVWRPC